MHLARAVLAAVVLAASPVLSAAPCGGFTDVDDSNPAYAPFCENVEWIKNRGVTLGCDTGLYCPNQAVTRLQMAAFMNRLGNVVFQQGGNAFGTTARLGTADQQDLELVVGNQRVAWFEHLDAQTNVAFGSNHVFGNLGRAMTIAGGYNNFVNGFWGTVGGGTGNRASANGTVSGGQDNQAGQSAAIGGGSSNVAGVGGIIPGGSGNSANGNSAFAAGVRAKANHSQCFVWGGATNGDTSCFAAREVVMSGLGGFYFWTAGADDNTYSGARLAPGTGAWAAYSDRNGKERFDLVDSGDVLQKLIEMPIGTWQWRAEPGAVRHMGPTAQDFHAAFGLGARDTDIVTVDADGVALAAIQGLNAKLEDRLAARDAEIAALRAEVAELRALRAEVAAIRAALPLTAVAASTRP